VSILSTRLELCAKICVGILLAARGDLDPELCGTFRISLYFSIWVVSNCAAPMRKIVFLRVSTAAAATLLESS
jgi:hypothetical protein